MESLQTSKDKELEHLIEGKTDYMYFSASELSREGIIDKINSLLITLFPDCSTQGEFLEKEQKDYIIYELHVHSKKICPSIKIFDFGDKIKLIKA